MHVICHNHRSKFWASREGQSYLLRPHVCVYVCLSVCLFRCVCVSLRVSKLAILYSLNVGAVTGDIFNLSIFINSTNDILFLQGSSSFGAQNTPAQSVSKKTSVKLKLLVR